MRPEADAAALAACLWLLVAATPATAADPEDPGPHAVSKSTHTEQLAGRSIVFDLYRPQQLAAPAPLVVLGHGFQRKKENLAGWGEALAQHGYLAAVPDFPGLLPDHAVNSAVLVALIDWIVARGADAQSPLHGLVDSTRRGALGHSAGGLAAFLAAATAAEIDVVVGLDPVDHADQGRNQAPAVTAASVIIRAAPGACNAQGNAQEIFAALTAPKLTLRVKDSGHCDAESPSDALCGVFCGGSADAARHAIYRRYALATLNYVLRCEVQLAPWLGGVAAQADPAIEDLRASGFPPAQLGCGAASPADAGPPGDTAASAGDGEPLVDGPPAAVDSGPPGPGDAAPTLDDAGGAGHDAGGCGCVTAWSTPRAWGPLPALLIAGLITMRARRRRRRAQRGRLRPAPVPLSGCSRPDNGSSPERTRPAAAAG